MGTTLEDASKNAAVNALTNVVGTFIDSRTLIYKKTKISGEILKTAQSLSKDIKSYSQGSISYFELLEAEEINGIYRVTARVDVRVEDFKNYIKKYALGEQSIDVGLFANMATDKDQLEEKYNLLVDNIIEPMATGQVYDIELSPPISFNDWPFMQHHVVKLNKLGISEMDAIVFKMTIRLDKDFKENMLNTLKNIADKKERIKQNTCTGDYGQCLNQEDYGVSEDDIRKSFKVGVYEKESKVTDVYLMKSIRFASYEKWGGTSYLLDRTKPYAWITGLDACRDQDRKGHKPMSHLSVNILNSLGSAIDAIELTPNTYGWEEKNIGFSLISSPLSGLMDRDLKKDLFKLGFSHHLLNIQMPEKNKYCQSSNPFYGLADVTVFDELTYWLILKLNQETVRNAKSVVVEMIE